MSQIQMSQIQMILHFNVDLQEPLVTQTLTTVFQQGDEDANVIEIQLKNGEKTADVSGNTVSGYFLRADGERVLLSGTAVGDKVRVELEQACYAAPGAIGALIRLADAAGVKRTLRRFAANVESEGEGPIIDTGHRIPSVEDVIAKLEEMDEAIQEANEAAENARNSAKPPYVGENGNWFVWDAETADYSDTGTKAQGPEGPTGPEGKAPYIGENGNWYTWDAETGEYSDTGTKAQGPKGEMGSRGPEGKPFRILGTYASLDALSAAITSPEQGDVYNVGESEPYSMYMWDTTGGTGHWLYLGELGSGGSGTVQSVDGVLADEDGNVPLNAVRYDGQQLTEEQQTAARTTLSVYSKSEIDEKTSAMLRFRHQFDIPAQPWVKVNDYYRIETQIDFESMGLTEAAYEQIQVAANDDRVDIQVYPIPLQLPEYAKCEIWLYNCTFTSSGPAFLFYAKQVPSSFIVVNLRMEVY